MPIEGITVEGFPIFGPYSICNKVGNMLYVSGQVAAKDGKPAGDVVEQAEIAITNLGKILETAGSSLQKVIKTTVFLTNMDDFARVNEVYARHFTGTPKPARSCVAVARLPLGVSFEIECVALVE
eukprot:gnl/Chilomastix_caulleri/80.p1 GENE.gnl/Chilomastix_caulleri/80~~gnl/Chilomastix_caulleri/80.p1  ORF type:complete len:144 (+),score=53.00 gnl/Chilomastix_caulleri/80:59-433(+)